LLQRNAVEVVNVMLSRAVAGLTSLHREERRWLRSPKVSDPDVRPLARLQEPDSQDRYHNYWRRFICYLLRVWESKQECREERRAGSESDDDEISNSRGRDLNTPDDSEDNEDSEDGETATQDAGPTDTLEDARRLVILTSRQLELLQELNDKLLANEDEVNMNARVETMLELCKTLILCKFAKSEFECPLVHFCAVLGIDGENGRLRRAAAYSYMLAGVVYCVRVLFAEILLPSTQREEQNEDPAWREDFLKQRVQYLVDGTHTPMSTMISLLAYSKYIAMNEGNAGMISWSQDRQTMYYRGFPIELTNFRFMIHDIVARATKLLWEDLMWVKDEQDRWTVPLDKIEDDITFTKRGWSFMSRKENGLDAETCIQWMMDQAARLEGSDQLMDKNGWRKRAVRRYLKLDEEFQELLAIVCHLTEGMLARVKEFLIIRAENGTTQDRGIFIIDGKVVLVTRYSKQQAITDRPKLIPRWLPSPIDQLKVLYMAYARRWCSYLREEVLGVESREYMWYDKNGPWETPRMTKIIQRETERYLSRAFGSLDMRHQTFGWANEHVDPHFSRGAKDEVGEVEEPEVEEEDIRHLGAGRGEIQGDLKYAVPVDIINHLSIRSLRAFRPLSEAWHQFLGFCGPSENERLRSESGKRLAVRLYDDDDAETRSRSRSRGRTGQPAWRRLFDSSPPNAVVDKQSRSQSGSRINWQGPERASQSSPLAGERFSQVAILNQHGSSRQGDGLYSTASRQSDQGSARESGQADFSHFTNEELETAVMPSLRQILKNPDAEFRSMEQRQAMFAVLKRETPLVVVLPTGGGKTLLATLPALMDSTRVHVFIAPFRALVNNMVERFRTDGLEAIEWRHGERNPSSIVVVSANIAVQWGFLVYAQEMQKKGLLAGIYFDEAHLTFTASDWRKELAELRLLRVVGCPVILLTATLPPLLENELRIAMDVRNARVIRASTIRLFHRYVVRRVAVQNMMDEVLAICRSRVMNFKRGEKGIVYSLSRDACESLAAQLGCGHYHAGVVDREEKLQSWLDRGGFITATSALGTGVDFRGIVFVLHIDLPWSMIDFAQESGRAGRDGEVVTSMILVPENVVEVKLQQGGMSLDRSAIAEFITSRGCRRRTMSAYLDGEEMAKSCSDLVNCAQCDRCNEGLTEFRETARSRTEEWEQVRRELDRLVGSCVWCWSQEESVEQLWREHSIETCQRSWLGLSMDEVKRFRAQIVYEKKGHTCHRCGISQNFCATKEDAAQACQWPFVVAPLLLGIIQFPNGVEEVRDGMLQILNGLGYGGGLGDSQAFARWVGKCHKRPIWGVWMSNGMAVVIHIILRALGNVDE
jgi:superfamily II DNA helicase RecQ